MAICELACSACQTVAFGEGWCLEWCSENYLQKTFDIFVGFLLTAKSKLWVGSQHSGHCCSTKTAQPRNRATAQPRNRATAQPRNSAGNPFTQSKPDFACMRKARHSVRAGLCRRAPYDGQKTARITNCRNLPDASPKCSGMRPNIFGNCLFADTQLTTLSHQLIMGKPETRKYKAVFFLGKSEIGLENDVAGAKTKP